MRPLSIIIIAVLFVSIGCAQGGADVPVTPGPDGHVGTTLDSGGQAVRGGGYVNWGFYRLEIGRDGSYAHVIPHRMASTLWEYPLWGYHLNAVKLLETAPCTDCLRLGNVHVLPNGDVSVDVSIRHPWPALPTVNRYCTGFDVRGIIMFPASQYFPDNELRAEAGLEPWHTWFQRYSTHDKGDAELMNPDGWTTIWAPDLEWYGYEVGEGFPIFEYYRGKMASGEELGTINAFKRFYSNENRHMFEVGETVTRTYIIRPPAQGPIEASYAIYAHWAEPVTTPVVNPAVDFPREANSPMPYEFWITQDGIIDPDAPAPERGRHIHWHIKTWDIGYADWLNTKVDLLYVCCGGGDLYPHPDGEPDDYWAMDFCFEGPVYYPSGLPGEWPYIFKVEIFDPDEPAYGLPIGTDYYIAEVALGALDGEW